MTKGQTPFRRACIHGHFNVVELFGEQEVGQNGSFSKLSLESGSTLVLVKDW